MDLLEDMYRNALDGAVIHVDILHGFIFRVQSDPSLFRLGIITLQRGFLIVVHEGDNDLAGVGGTLLPDQNQITIVDSSVDHGLTNGAEQVELTLAKDLLRQLYVVFDFIHQHVAALLDPTDFFDALAGKQINNQFEYLENYDRYIEKTISYDPKFKVLVCVVRDITDQQLQKMAHEKLLNDTIRITDSLLDQNMRSVHEIASLLGETAAETKVALENLKGLVKDEKR